MKALLVVASAAVLAIAGCSSSTDSDAESTASPTATTGGGKCTEADLAAALPEGSTVSKYDCADVEGTEWAAVEVSEGPTVFFLTRDGDRWDVSTSDEICGAASAGLPDSLLSYCD